MTTMTIATKPTSRSVPSTETPGSGSARRAIPTGIKGDANTPTPTATIAAHARDREGRDGVGRDPLEPRHPERGELSIVRAMGGEVPREGLCDGDAAGKCCDEGEQQ